MFFFGGIAMGLSVNLFYRAALSHNINLKLSLCESLLWFHNKQLKQKLDTFSVIIFLTNDVIKQIIDCCTMF